MRLSTARDQFIADRRIGRPGKKALSPTTQKRYYFSITSFIDYLVATRSRPRQPGDSVLLFGADVAREFIRHRSGQDVSENTLHIDCAALREFAKWGARLRYWRAEDVAEMPAVDRPELLPRAMTNEERDRIMALPLEGEDAVLRGLLYYAGGRDAELLALRLLDVAAPTPLPDGGEAPGFLRLYGKGRRERIVHIHPALWAVLHPHLARQVGAHRDRTVLVKPDGSPWGYQMIWARVRRWGALAAVPGLTAHRFRHTFATNMLEATRDLQAVQQLLGHNRLTTTQIYSKVVDARRRDAVLALPSFTVQSAGSLSPGPPGRHDES